MSVIDLFLDLYIAGTFGVAQILADVTAAGGITIIGGGDSVSVVMMKCPTCMGFAMLQLQ